MNTNDASIHHLSNAQLLVEVQRLAASERCATAALIRALAELDERRLYLAEGFSSLFGYCTQVLRLSEHAAYDHIEAARCARKFPQVLALLEQGTVTLTTITLLAPHLTVENHVRVLDRARNKSKRDVECIVAQLRPAPDVPPTIRRLPDGPVGRATLQTALHVDVPLATTQHHAPVTSPSTHCPVIAPLAPERFRMQSPSRAKLMTSCAERKTCFVMPFQTGIPLKSSIARCPCWSSAWSGTSAHPHPDRELRAAQKRSPARGRYRRRSGVRYGSATMDNVHSWERVDVARSAASWSFTTSCRSRPAAPPMLMREQVERWT